MNTESHTIGGTEVEVHWKGIKNLHVGVYPPDGRVRVAAPEALSLDAIRLAVLTRIDWIRRKQAKFLAQERQPPRRYVSGETHYLFGKPLRLDVLEWDKKVHRIALQGSDRLRLSIPQGSSQRACRQWMDGWYKSRLRERAEPRLGYWSERLKVAPRSWGIRTMKTKWGSCNPEKKIVWINLELAKKPLAAMDYVLLHELAHLVSPRHDDRFIAVLNKHMPKWRSAREELNRYPLEPWSETVATPAT